MFERFTDQARRVLIRAQEVARDLCYSYVDTEHLLVALVELHESPSQKILLGEGYDAETIRSEIGKGTVNTTGHIPFTADCRRVMEYALHESLQRNSTSIEDIDLLLAILRPDSPSSATVILTALGDEEAVLSLRKAIAQRVENVSVVPDALTPKSEFIRILVPKDKVPEGGSDLIEQINDNLVDYSVEDLRRILQFVKDSRLRIASS